MTRNDTGTERYGSCRLEDGLYISPVQSNLCLRLLSGYVLTIRVCPLDVHFLIFAYLTMWERFLRLYQLYSTVGNDRQMESRPVNDLIGLQESSNCFFMGELHRSRRESVSAHDRRNHADPRSADAEPRKPCVDRTTAAAAASERYHGVRFAMQEIYLRRGLHGG